MVGESHRLLADIEDVRFAVGLDAEIIDYVRHRMVTFAKAVVRDRLMVRPMATTQDLK